MYGCLGDSCHHLVFVFPLSVFRQIVHIKHQVLIVLTTYVWRDGCISNMQIIIYCIILDFYTQHNISIYHRTQSAIWPIRLNKVQSKLSSDLHSPNWNGQRLKDVCACTWVWTHVLCTPRRVCYPLGHSGRCNTAIYNVIYNTKCCTEYLECKICTI